MTRRFSNPWPHPQHRFLDIVRWKLGKHLADPLWNGVASDEPAARQELSRESIATPPASGWRVSWLGHASFLVQGAGLSLLIDPVFSDHCAPLPLPAMKRLVNPPCRLADLPKIDFVLLSHGHYDHLDLPTLRKLGTHMPILIADGHQHWLGRRGFHEVRQVPWFDSVEIVPGVKITATPAQHFTARTPWDRNRGHWCGWIIEGAGKRLWHAGDSAWCPAFEEIGRRFPRSISG
jgi:N-acyl-phosphatidylethanolamine-hydrolysing phospholipase D